VQHQFERPILERAQGNALNRSQTGSIRLAVTSTENHSMGAILGAILACVMALLWAPRPAISGKPHDFSTGILHGKTRSGFLYMSGGVSVREQQAMEGQSAAYNLKLVFTPKLGSASAPILLLLGDNHRGSIDAIPLQGPWFYAQLPLGTYTFMARIRNQVVLFRDVYLQENRRTFFFAYGGERLD
jgi:hypothetical protein